MVKTPAHQWQQCHHGQGNNSSLQQAMRAKTINNSTTAETPVHQQWQ
jgi:hypothetical protein